MPQNVYRDMLLWTGWNPGMVTTGGTVVGANPNPTVSPAGLLALDPTTGIITVTLPALPTGFSGWATKIEATLEGISIPASPVIYTPLNVAIKTVGHTGTTYFEDADWGNFVSYSNGNITATTRMHGAYSAGSIQFVMFTAGVRNMDQYQVRLNTKLHFMVDLVAY